MRIQITDTDEDVTVRCTVGHIPVPGTYGSVGYLKAEGVYKPGSAGKDDAGHIVGMLAYARARFYNPRWLVDFSELSYVWGDEMDWVLDRIFSDHLAALVVGPACMGAISTLGDMDASPESCLEAEGHFRSLEAAFRYLCRKRG